MKRTPSYVLTHSQEDLKKEEEIYFKKLFSRQRRTKIICSVSEKFCNYVMNIK